MDITDLSVTQMVNARAIYVAAVPFGADAAKAALMAAGAESSYLVFANDGSTTREDVPVTWRAIAALSMQFPHDAVAGSAWTTADSVGLFQQRPMFGYCPADHAGIAQLMDPGESTRIFVRGSDGGSGFTRFFRQSPTTLTLAQRVQWTQGSEFPTGENYVGFTTVANQLMARFGAIEEPAVNRTVELADWITMTDQTTLDAQWDRIADKVRARVADLEDQIADKVRARVFDLETDPDIMALHNKSLFAQDTGLGMGFAAQIAQVLARLDRIEQALSQRVA